MVEIVHCLKELRDTTNFFLKNTYKSLQDLFSGSHYIETKKMASLIFFIFKYFGAGGGNNRTKKSKNSISLNE